MREALAPVINEGPTIDDDRSRYHGPNPVPSACPPPWPKPGARQPALRSPSFVTSQLAAKSALA